MTADYPATSDLDRHSISTRSADAAGEPDFAGAGAFRPTGAVASAAALVVELGAFRLGPIDLSVQAGEIMCLVGPNGAGKSTLLRALTGLVAPESGRAEIVGATVLGRSQPVLRALGWVPDDLDDILPELAAEELWELHALAHASVHGDIEAMRDRAAALAKLLDFQPPPTRLAVYSHGMRKKTQLIAGLLHDPAIVFLDEPRDGLDPIACERLEDLLRNLRDEGRGILVATHDLRYAERTADRVCVLHRGKVVALGPPDSLLEDGETDIVAAFLRLLDS